VAIGLPSWESALNAPALGADGSKCWATVFTTPWTATLTYVPGPDVLSEAVCAENLHQYYYDSSDTNAPRAEKPDF
jgi:hypothetical protein